jgi:hypothetical protein
MELNPNIIHFHAFSFILTMLNSLKRKENYFDVNITSEGLWLFDRTLVTNVYYGGCTLSALRYWG